ncbi:TetR/AcrR family transcriptional regulator [Halosegnis longus]|uniref:TetR/AcrR family transcriptional regulator n=1 Tax=Halosegnis longus TaxID=2216012 RepID=A0AAJ4UWI2_9EURY|nr:TetR/AcrR family transcriptional regulator [Salella cibi]
MDDYDISKKSDTQIAIIEATFQAVAETGYADLTIDKVNDRFAKSKPLIYYHYEDREDLVEELLRYAVAKFLKELPDDGEIDSAGETLYTLIDRIFPEQPSEQVVAGRRVITELRGAAVAEPVFQDIFAEFDDQIRAIVKTTIARGVLTGEFHRVDAQRVADDFMVLVNGALLMDTSAPETATTTVVKPLYELIQRLEKRAGPAELPSVDDIKDRDSR